jgi:hypothetical protein
LSYNRLKAFAQSIDVICFIFPKPREVIDCGETYFINLYKEIKAKAEKNELKAKIINQEKKFKFTSEKMDSDLNLIRKE